MNAIWMVVTALVGVVGLILTFGGVSKLAQMRLGSGVSRLVFGVAFGAAAFGIGAAGLNLQTYKKLTYERPVATITFTAVENDPGAYEVEMLLPEDEYFSCDTVDGPKNCIVRGGEFAMGARVITFKPFANLIGYDSVYKLDYIEGRNTRRYTSRAVSTSEATGVALSDNPGLDVGALARAQGSRLGVRDANFGSAVYNPMGDGLSYEVSITRTGLIARAANADTRRALGELIGETAVSKSAAKTPKTETKD